MAKFELSLALVEMEQDIRAILEYNSDLFAAETAERLMHHYKRLLSAAVADPEAAIGRLPLELESRPMTASACIGRRALPEPNQRPAVAYRAPSSAAEQLVARIWAEILGMEQVGVDDDFFALGGHSLLATRLVARILKHYPKRPIAVLEVFRRRTVSRLAELLASES